MTQWPLQKDCDVFYGNPRGRNGQVSVAWVSQNISCIRPPFVMRYAGKPVKSITFHRKAAFALLNALYAIWIASGKNQAKIDEWGVSTFGGSFNFRLKRNSNSLSMHAYGCAIDLAPERFPMGQTAKHFVPEVVKAFADQGAINLSDDPMHFQFARLK
jgi:D-alanyl-D-alanine carboxypeptidase